jgi:hypothetical protein
VNTVISLKEVVDAFDMVGDEVSCFLNPETGEIRTITSEDYALVEQDGSPDELAEWERDAIPLIREVVDSGTWLALPGRFEIHEWSIMESFARLAPEESHREQLMDAIHGGGAFRRFKSAVHRLRIERDWYAFREEALSNIARSWLDSHGLTYR